MGFDGEGYGLREEEKERQERIRNCTNERDRLLEIHYPEAARAKRQLAVQWPAYWLIIISLVVFAFSHWVGGIIFLLGAGLYIYGESIE